MSDPIRVLCVDDNADEAESLGRLLKGAGCDVRVCFDGPSALDVAEAFRPDVCLIDVQMPGMTGDELAEKLRGRAGDRPVRYVAVTGLWDPDAFHRTKGCGCTEHIVKPIDPDRLIALVTGRAPAGTA